MIKQLKYSSLLLTFFMVSCLFYDPINTEVESYFTFTGNLEVHNPIALNYNDKQKDKELTLKWQISKLPSHSELSIDSFLPSNNPNKRVFIPDIPGEYQVSLTVEDQYSSTTTTTHSIQIKNNLPVAVIKSLNAGEDFFTHRELLFTSINSYDPDYEEHPTPKWSVVNAPKGNNVIDLQADTTEFKLIPNVSGNYTIKLIVTDINEGENFTYYSFYVHSPKRPEVVETLPDHTIQMIPISETETQVFQATILDPSSDFQSLNYQWFISINNQNYELLSNNQELQFNGSNYAIGDFIQLKLEAINKYGLSSSTVWSLVITE